MSTAGDMTILPKGEGARLPVCLRDPEVQDAVIRSYALGHGLKKSAHAAGIMARVLINVVNDMEATVDEGAYGMDERSAFVRRLYMARAGLVDEALTRMHEVAATTTDYVRALNEMDRHGEAVVVEADDEHELPELVVHSASPYTNGHTNGSSHNPVVTSPRPSVGDWQ